MTEGVSAERKSRSAQEGKVSGVPDLESGISSPLKSKPGTRMLISEESRFMKQTLCSSYTPAPELPWRGHPGHTLYGALAEVDLLLASWAYMLFAELIGENLFFFPAFRTLTHKRAQILESFIPGTMCRRLHPILPFDFRSPSTPFVPERRKHRLSTTAGSTHRERYTRPLLDPIEKSQL